jgi:hypothetical protein
MLDHLRDQALKRQEWLNSQKQILRASIVSKKEKMGLKEELRIKDRTREHFSEQYPIAIENAQKNIWNY